MRKWIRFYFQHFGIRAATMLVMKRMASLARNIFERCDLGRCPRLSWVALSGREKKPNARRGCILLPSYQIKNQQSSFINRQSFVRSGLVIRFE
jgi:hypothetical protein